MVMGIARHKQCIVTTENFLLICVSSNITQPIIQLITVPSEPEPESGGLTNISSLVINVFLIDYLFLFLILYHS